MRKIAKFISFAMRIFAKLCASVPRVPVQKSSTEICCNDTAFSGYYQKFVTFIVEIDNLNRRYLTVVSYIYIHPNLHPYRHNYVNIP